MNPCIEIIDFGIKDYEDILMFQNDLFNSLIAKKKGNIPINTEYLLIGEHFPVITMGRHAKPQNILLSSEDLKEKGIKIFNIGRGGDVTFHSSGQLIVYPVIDMESHKLGVKKYVELLETCVIRLLNKYGIVSSTIEGAPGVWIKSGEKEEKICALGIKCSRFCTMHGIALNVNTDLDGFKMINPCGFTSKGVTSMKKILGKNLNIQKIKKEFSDIFLSLIFPL